MHQPDACPVRLQAHRDWRFRSAGSEVMRPGQVAGGRGRYLRDSLAARVPPSARRTHRVACPLAITRPSGTGSVLRQGSRPELPSQYCMVRNQARKSCAVARDQLQDARQPAQHRASYVRPSSSDALLCRSRRPAGFFMQLAGKAFGLRLDHIQTFPSASGERSWRRPTMQATIASQWSRRASRSGTNRLDVFFEEQNGLHDNDVGARDVLHGSACHGASDWSLPHSAAA